jgi:hypothetical protein
VSEGARSYTGKVVGGDSYAITINFKWMIQVCTLIGGLLYGFWEIENRIAKLEEEVLEANNEIRNLMAKHQLEESAQLEELEQKLKFYEKELNINPLSWRKRKKK